MPLTDRVLKIAATVLCSLILIVKLSGEPAQPVVTIYSTSTYLDFTPHGSSSSDQSSLSQHEAFTPVSNPDGYAYMTLLTGTMANLSDPNINNDPYFVATRLLGWQLMHSKHTKTTNNIPFVVMITKKCPPEWSDRLRRDGAVVIEVEEVHTENEWVVPEMPQWVDLMTKLRGWQLTQYKKVLFLDGDMILARPLDEVFTDPGATFAWSNDTAESPDDEAPVPPEYLLATIPETNPNHEYPPNVENDDFKDPNYFNAGFFLFAPSQQMYDYYYSILSIENRFNMKYAEQNLLNYAHRRGGKVPWRNLDLKWNVRFPNKKDWEKGVHSLHDKWWKPHMDKSLQPLYTRNRWSMEGFYEGWDALL